MKLIIERTIGPLVREKLDAFRERAAALGSDRRSKDARLDELRRIDAAEQILNLKIVDPAMGSGHFLVSLVDYLAEQITTAMGEAHEAVTWGGLFLTIDSSARYYLGKNSQRGRRPSLGGARRAARGQEFAQALRA